jgi:hypothetical protein
MAYADVSDTLSVQGITSETIVDGVQRLWLNGISFGSEVDIGSYQDSSNLTTENDDHPLLLRNVKYVAPDQAQIETLQPSSYGPSYYGLDTYAGTRATGAGPTITLPIPTNVCQLHFKIDSDLPITITGARFYAYDGIDDVNLFPKIQFHAAEGGTNGLWTTANGSSQSLLLSQQASATTHDYFIALSASPTATGDKQGKIKFVYTYTQS